jgi:predicted 3-demethylubiquinone-9 3-methyltransferase (glyoxalase superfamily)
MTTVRPFLMFQGNAEEAINFYVSLFPGGEILSIKRFGPEGPGKEGAMERAVFSIGSQTVLALDSYVKHEFTFTPAFSLFVECETGAEVERLFAALSEGGALLMPLGDYGFSRKFGWVNDRFGVSWQLSFQ